MSISRRNNTMGITCNCGTSSTSSSLTTIISDISNYKAVLSVKVTDGLVEIEKLVFVLLIYS